MASQSAGAPRLLSLRELGEYIHRPWRTLERTLAKNPPKNFPAAIQFGRRVFWSRDQVDAWLRGEATVPAVPLVKPPQTPPAPGKRGRGRPRKQPLQNVNKVA